MIGNQFLPLAQNGVPPLMPAMARMETMLASLNAFSNNGTTIRRRRRQTPFDAVGPPALPTPAATVSVLFNPRPINPNFAAGNCLPKAKIEHLLVDLPQQHQLSLPTLVGGAGDASQPATAMCCQPATTTAASSPPVSSSVGAADADAVAAAVKTEEHFRQAKSSGGNESGTDNGGSGSSNFLFSISFILRDSLLQAASFSSSGGCSANGMP
ncbi:hypothetical protein niasHS_015997 [Heterodera schachtii]|uniref:Uncharacterized protein n=2 Tax=Heterodera TaxID=34509 RepID=A0ABD2HTZ6_HETSC